MKEAIFRFGQLLQSGQDYLSHCPETELARKSSPEKWSKKEILGHLIDSAIHNLKRFTEVQFEAKPYRINRYDQNALVKANNYQEAETEEIISLWLALNIRIVNIMKFQTGTTLNYPVIIGENDIRDLRFLMIDYIDHLEHHLEQIKTN